VARADYARRNPPAAAVVSLFDLQTWQDFKRVLDAVLREFDALYAPAWPEENRLAVALANAVEFYRAHGEDLRATLEAIRRREITKAPASHLDIYTKETRR
jgi:hypothetical protein